MKLRTDLSSRTEIEKLASPNGYMKAGGKNGPRKSVWGPTTAAFIGHLMVL